ncbi:MAG: nitroreductase family protein [Coriobacteriales bacterium]|nr:nitroreductase family protein [Coriobacteriales bacterium]
MQHKHQSKFGAKATKATPEDAAREQLIRAIETRHSVRQYIDQPIRPEHRQALQKAIEQANAEAHLNIQLVCDEPQAFQSFLAHYGKFENVRNYLALVGPKGKDLDELCGYFGERIVLQAQQLGLRTCWVGGTFSRRKARVQVAHGQKLVVVIAVGYGATDGRRSRSKQLSELCNTHGLAMPGWFKEGMEAAMLAPTALNQQHFIFTLSKDQTEVVAQSTGGPLSNVDLGIVEYHFEAVSGHKVTGSAIERLGSQ